MKKIKYLLLLILCAPFVAFAATGSYGMDYSTCISFANTKKQITGSYEYKYCYRAGCSTSGKWNLANMVASSGYSCFNGNTDPYVKVTSDGCSQFTGSCQINSGVYCTTVKQVDCDRKSNGSSYGGGSTPTPTTPTKKVTNKTTKGTTTTRATSGGSRIIITTTKSTTTGDNTRPVITTEEETTEPPKSDNLKINYITINNVDIKYQEGYNEYTIKLKKGVRELDIVVDTEDERTITYIEGAYNMPDEDSVVKIEVVAENGDTKVITINVKRYEGESGDCNIANIAITNYEINHFDKNKFDYTLNVSGKTKTLNMEIIPSDPLHAVYEVKGNENLQNNSIVTIAVEAEDGTMCYYTIKVRKTSSFWLILFIIIIVTILLLLAGYFVYRFIKRSKNQYEYE